VLLFFPGITLTPYLILSEGMEGLYGTAHIFSDGFQILVAEQILDTLQKFRPHNGYKMGVISFANIVNLNHLAL
jgi:hypothetical protein